MSEFLGFIGLGSMGAGMASNLQKAGYELKVFDADSEREQPFSLVADSVEDLAKKCETVILCLPNPEASSRVIFDQLLTDGGAVKTIIETSTLTPELVKEFGDKLTAKNLQFLSTPMVGGKNQASDGTIEFLVEGSADCLAKNQKLFDAMGSKVRYMGEAPSATLAKLTFNLCRYANLAVATEAYRLLRKYNANTKAIHEFMSEQSLDNFGQVWAEDMKDTMTKDVPFKPSQVPGKDLSLLIEMAKSHGIDKELTEAIKDTYSSMG